MSSKCKRIVIDLLIVLAICTSSAIAVNELRADKIPLLPAYLKNNFYQTVSLQEFLKDESFMSHCLLFDARPHMYYAKDSLTVAKNFPVTDFDFFYHLYLPEGSSDTPIFVYGRTLSRACDLELAHRLSLKGHKHIVIVENE
ncbi:MAG: hypothetical protein AB1390_04485 [Nitrospirota bacterium]